jgi:hypothetical protein
LLHLPFNFLLSLANLPIDSFVFLVDFVAQVDKVTLLLLQRLLRDVLCPPIGLTEVVGCLAPHLLHGFKLLVCLF